MYNKTFNFILLFNYLDKAIGMIEKACLENDYIMMITADHGNAEQMLDEKGKPHTAHTCNKGNFMNFNL